MQCCRLLFLIVLGLNTTSAQAGLVALTYRGANEDNAFIQAVGSESFSYATGATSLTLASLTAFSFNQITTLSDPGLMGSSSYTYSLGDLISFSATLSATGSVTTLSFRTGYENASNGFLNPQYFVVGSLRSNGATFYQSGPDGDVTTGTVIATSVVPEPASLTLCGFAGLIGCLVAKRRLGTVQGARPAGDGRSGDRMYNHSCCQFVTVSDGRLTPARLSAG